jgi:hypothetical protein
MIQSNHSGSIQGNSKTQYDMPHESYAQSLRGIGQALETLRINAFALEKDGDNYIVRDWEPSFLKNIAAEIWGLDASGQTSFTNKKSGDLLVYDSSDAERLEATGRARRGSKELQDTKISTGLRIVGDYLDKNGAVAFNISWSIESVRVRYQTPAGDSKDRNFTMQNLQELGVGMYLRRPSRQRVK